MIAIMRLAIVAHLNLFILRTLRNSTGWGIVTVPPTVSRGRTVTVPHHVVLLQKTCKARLGHSLVSLLYKNCTYLKIFKIIISTVIICSILEIRFKIHKLL